ncbi:MAG: hypothetical protein Q8N36_02200, partial [bacterium]|nr:hypothetical protein [bacterium]
MKWDKIFIVLAIAGFFFNLALGMQTTVHMNYVSQEIGLTADKIGLLDGIREIPGLLTAVLAMAALFFTESILAAICLVAVSLGLLIYGQAVGFDGIVIGTLVMSLGFHLYFPVQSSILLRTSAPNERGRRLGTLNSIAAAATVCASLLVRWLAPLSGMRSIIFWAAAMALVGAGVQAVARRSDKVNIRRGMVFKWSYKSYYGLTLL